MRGFKYYMVGLHVYAKSSGRVRKWISKVAIEITDLVYYTVLYSLGLNCLREASKQTYSTNSTLQGYT